MKAKFITPLQKQLLASIASLAILTTALLFFWLGHGKTPMPEPKIIIREVSLVKSPPPPPPPTAQQTMVEAPITLQVQGAGPSIQMMLIDPTITMTKPDIPVITSTQSKWQSLEIDWHAFELDQLDALPSLLTSLQIKFPKSLSRKGIKSVLIKLDIMIDEQGRLTLINIIENPYIELNTEIQRLIKMSRFSAPKKDNQPARARFIWPVQIES